MKNRKDIILTEITSTIDKHIDFFLEKPKTVSDNLLHFKIEEDTPALKALLMNHFNALNWTYSDLRSRYRELGRESSMYNDIKTLNEKSAMQDKKIYVFLDVLELDLYVIPRTEEFDKISFAKEQFKSLLQNMPKDIALEILDDIKGEL